MEEFKVAPYIRVSSKEQAKEGYSIDAQKNKISAYCILKGWTIYGWYIDAGKTAGTLSKKRPDFERIVVDALNKKFNAMIITKMDRAFRNTKQALDTLEKFERVNVQFISLYETIDTTTAMGKFFFTLINALAQLERDLTVERLSDTFDEKFTQGRLIGKMPLGYKWDKKNKIPVIDLKYCGVIKGVFDDTLNNINYKTICLKYKIPIKSYYNILKNKSYIGYVRFDGKEMKGLHQPLISEELFNQVQEKLKNNKLGKNNG